MGEVKETCQKMPTTEDFNFPLSNGVCAVLMVKAN